MQQTAGGQSELLQPPHWRRDAREERQTTDQGAAMEEIESVLENNATVAHMNVCMYVCMNE